MSTPIIFNDPNDRSESPHSSGKELIYKFLFYGCLLPFAIVFLLFATCLGTVLLWKI